MTTNTTLIRLPNERADQLRALAQTTGETMTDIVGRLVTAELRRCGLSTVPPGFTVGRELIDGAPVVRFGIDQVKTMWLAGRYFKALADALEKSAAPAGGVGSVEIEILGGDKLTVARIANSVAVEIADGGTRRTARRTLALTVARDLAREIRKASADPR